MSFRSMTVHFHVLIVQSNTKEPFTSTRSLRPVHFRLDSSKEKNWGPTLYLSQTMTLAARWRRSTFGTHPSSPVGFDVYEMPRDIPRWRCSKLLKACHMISGSHLERNCSRQFTEEVMANCQLLTIFWVWLKVSHADPILKDSYSIGFTALES